MTLPWKLVWITGASTGIGSEIARQLASQGVTVAASARSVDKLAALGAEHIRIKPFPLDVSNAEIVGKTFNNIEKTLGPIDLIIASAANYTPIELDNFDPKLFDEMYRVNYLGVINTIAAALPTFRKRKFGHISWVASVSGYTGLPKAAGYGPTKAALINLAESMKPELDRDNVKISVINPGFVKTPMTAKNDFEMPFLMEASEAARLTIVGLAKGKFEVAYPMPFVAILKFARLLPYWLYFKLIKKAVLKN